LFKGVELSLNYSSVSSLIFGLVLLGGTWYFHFSQGGGVPLAESLGALVVNGLIIGGLAWLGLILLILGLLIVFI